MIIKALLLLIFIGYTLYGAWDMGGWKLLLFIALLWAMLAAGACP